MFGYVVGLDFFDGVEADEVEDVGEFGDEEVVEMSIALKHVAKKVSEKHNLAYSRVVGYLRAMFSFEMMRLALICLRGSRSRFTTCVGNDVNDTAAILSGLRM